MHLLMNYTFRRSSEWLQKKTNDCKKGGACRRTTPWIRGYIRASDNNLRRIRVKICFSCRSSRSQIFFKIDVIKNVATFARKYLCWNHFLINFSQLQACSFIKKKNSNTSVFTWILRNFLEQRLYRTPLAAASVSV